MLQNSSRRQQKSFAHDDWTCAFLKTTVSIQTMKMECFLFAIVFVAVDGWVIVDVVRLHKNVEYYCMNDDVLVEAEVYDKLVTFDVIHLSRCISHISTKPFYI